VWGDRSLARREEEIEMARKRRSGRSLAYSKLGDFIFDQNPYGTDLRYPQNYKKARIAKYGLGKRFDADRPFGVLDVRKDPKLRRLYRKGLFWPLNGAKRRVSKALRIPYTFKDPAGKLHRGALLIGYEGAGGGP